MKTIITAAILLLTASCATSHSGLRVPAKFGNALCYDSASGTTGLIPFKGDVVISGNWMILDPLNNSHADKVIISMPCLITISNVGLNIDNAQD